MTASDRGRRVASAAFALSFALSVYALLTPEARGAGLVDLPGEDKLVHLALFALLAATAVWRFGRGRHVLAALAAYAVATEVAQALWLDGRGGDALDVVADVVGITTGLAVALAWRPAAMGSVGADDPT